jgi:hypothetical protein
MEVICNGLFIAGHSSLFGIDQSIQIAHITNGCTLSKALLAEQESA